MNEWILCTSSIKKMYIEERWEKYKEAPTPVFVKLCILSTIVPYQMPQCIQPVHLSLAHPEKVRVCMKIPHCVDIMNKEFTWHSLRRSKFNQVVNVGTCGPRRIIAQYGWNASFGMQIEPMTKKCSEWWNILGWQEQDMVVVESIRGRFWPKSFLWKRF